MGTYFDSFSREIRDMIFRYVVVEEDSDELRLTPKEEGLLCVNRQIYEEASRVFYEESSFLIDLDGIPNGDEWVNMGEKHRYVKGACMEFLFVSNMKF